MAVVIKIWMTMAKNNARCSCYREARCGYHIVVVAILGLVLDDVDAVTSHCIVKLLM